MSTFKDEWKSTKANPDEEFLKKNWKAEVENLEQSFAKMKQFSEARIEKTKPLIEKIGFKQADIDRMIQDDIVISKNLYTEAERRVQKPAYDIEALHTKDLEVAKSLEKKLKSPGNPHWHGYLFNPSYGGGWWAWNGEAEEIPSITFNVGNNKIDPRTQAWGEGWYDADYSEMHGYLAFQLTPPSWGRLTVSAYTWCHGYYNLYSNDAWYKSEHAKAQLHTWIDIHQNFWRSRSYLSRFYMSGSELHPERANRIDNLYYQSYATNIGEGDLVTIRVGVKLYCRAKASGGRARLNFQAGGANYVYTPYIYWRLDL